MIIIIWLSLTILWIVIDICRYIRYVINYKKFNEPVKHRDTNHENIKILLKDLDENTDMFEILIKDLFFNKMEIEDVNYDDVCLSIFEMVGEFNEYRDEIKKLVKRFQLKMRKQKRNVFTSPHRSLRVKSQKHDIKSWFNILPIYMLTRSINIYVSTYMLFLGYKHKTCDNGLKIWYSPYKKEYGTPIVFFHGSVGGLTVQYFALKYFYFKHNIIFPEIPGISFLDADDKPPALSEIIDNVNDFLQYYAKEQMTDSEINNDPDKLKINLLGHSLGTILCASYINKYPKNIDTFFCVEGQIFFHRIMKVCTELNRELKEIPQEDLISVPLFHRDLYVQYFLIKRFTMDYTMLYDMSSEDKKKIKIYMYHAENDSRLLIQPQIEYAKRKNIQIKYHLFPGNLPHGAFVLNQNMRNYVLNDIYNIYDQQFFRSDKDLIKEQKNATGEA